MFVYSEKLSSDNFTEWNTCLRCGEGNGDENGDGEGLISEGNEIETNGETQDSQSQLPYNSAKQKGRWQAVGIEGWVLEFAAQKRNQVTAIAGGDLDK